MNIKTKTKNKNKTKQDKHEIKKLNRESSHTDFSPIDKYINRSLICYLFYTCTANKDEKQTEVLQETLYTCMLSVYSNNILKIKNIFTSL